MVFHKLQNNKFCVEQQYSIKLDGSFLETNFVDSSFLLLQLIFFHASNHLISTLLPAFGYDWFFSKQMNYNVVIHFCCKICYLSKVWLQTEIDCVNNICIYMKLLIVKPCVHRIGTITLEKKNILPQLWFLFWYSNILVL